MANETRRREEMRAQLQTGSEIRDLIAATIDRQQVMAAPEALSSPTPTVDHGVTDHSSSETQMRLDRRWSKQIGSMTLSFRWRVATS